MASVLQRMMKELARKQETATPSVLRTVAGGLGLLGALLDAGKLDSGLARHPPVKLLGVDDNAVCRQALVLALKQAFPAPDLASDGEAGLAKAQAQAYDAIFLDVEMPGMDAFDLCTKIRETPLNQNTPIVFVTKHSDFESRARSAACGGQDLIGKPYLPLEIALKALTVVIRERLRQRGIILASAETDWFAEVTSAPAPFGDPASSAVPAVSGPEAPEQAEPPEPQSSPACLEALKNAADDESRQEAIQSLLMAVHGLTGEAQWAKQDSAFQLGCAIENMLSQRIERSEYSADPGLTTLLTAVEAFHELLKPDLSALAEAPNDTAPLGSGLSPAPSPDVTVQRPAQACHRKRGHRHQRVGQG
ncbi:hypothetical protein SBV1_850019 [Verrucomicrobia bacterium]|nr:hypothetical protein SBV1_850019 [Verrucomicrobiota bacterium]